MGWCAHPHRSVNLPTPSNDGDVPLFWQAGDGNESDREVFGNLSAEFQQQWILDSVYVADARYIQRRTCKH